MRTQNVPPPGRLIRRGRLRMYWCKHFAGGFTGSFKWSRKHPRRMITFTYWPGRDPV